MANISAKELTSIEDQLSMEHLLVKKYNTYAATTSDTQLKAKCKEIANQHQQHYQTLLGYLN